MARKSRKKDYLDGVLERALNDARLAAAFAACDADGMVAVADLEPFWRDMLRQAHALRKRIREMAAEDGIDLSIMVDKEGNRFVRAFVYDRKLKGYVRNPLLVAEEEAREAEALERRSQMRVVDPA